MKQLLVLFSLLSSVAFAQYQDSFFIDTKISSGAVRIISLEQPEEIRVHFDQEQILNSNLTLELNGKLEGNLCGLKEIGLQTIYNHADSNYPNDVYDIKLLAFLKQERSISLNGSACLSISMPRPFKTLINIKPVGWSSEEREWKYRITVDGDVVKTLKVTLNETRGWSWQLL